ncbi:hypothetical protein EAG_09926 [Camponotus floridanus]|uniref:Uncharacterized protein n=1 Tax=Camponotus floridanus TaxID=104421 RepID=E2A6F1_CAMFO|nr:hypothetical protein EAG_09926 [Camponotus floridanus]
MRVVPAINGATSASNVFTELKPINARVCQLLTAWLAQPQRGATYRFASGRENEAPLLHPEDAECPIEAGLSLARIVGKNPQSIRLYQSPATFILIRNRENEITKLRILCILNHQI